MDQASGRPRSLPYNLLEKITNRFSNDRELGRGAYGKVYLGVHKDGEKIAVKMLRDTPGLDDEQFEKEYDNLENLQHRNIVRLVGYCNETRREYIAYEGKRIFCEVTHRLLCFEYMQNGSLQDCLSDESSGHDWCTRYGIIKGICMGLKYLHEELKPPIFHLDLKPDNILLGENLVPKIADFGLSRLFVGEKTQVTSSSIGTPGYIPPEYINMALISNKFDIFSFGVVVIRIMTGFEGYFRSAEMSSEEFVELVHAKWRNRLQATPVYHLEAYSEQVKRCIKIGLSCVEADRHKRPNIGDIFNQLKETEFNGLLDVYPLQLRFPFEPDKLISCPIRLTNNTDSHVAFRCVPKNSLNYSRGDCRHEALSQLHGILLPRSTCTYIVTMKEMQQPPPANTDTLDLVLSCVERKGMRDEDMHYSFFMQAKEESQSKVYHTTLTAVYEPVIKAIQPRIKVIPWDSEFGPWHSIDVHPTEPWILIGHQGGHVSIWDYQTRARVMSQIITTGSNTWGDYTTEFPSIGSAKFIARNIWFVAGDEEGYIHVHTCMAMDKLKKIKAHRDSVKSLSVHPSLTYVLSASDDHLIKLWNWDADWACIRIFKAHSKRVNQVIFNTQNGDTFASVSDDGTVKIWSTFSSDPITTLDCSPDCQACVSYFSTGGDQQFVITGSKRGTARIWDLQKNTCIQRIHGLRQVFDGCNVGVVDYLLDYPILISVSRHNSISLCNSTTYRHEITVDFKLGDVIAFAYIKSIRSLVIGFKNGAAIMEIGNPYPQRSGC